MAVRTTGDDGAQSVTEIRRLSQMKDELGNKEMRLCSSRTTPLR
jgi:hypothetical protein